MPPPPPAYLLDFSAAEWRVIFPTAPPSAGVLFADRLPLAADGAGGAHVGDKHTDAVESDPITYDRWLQAASKGGGAWLAFQERALRVLSPWATFSLTWFNPVLHILGLVCVMPVPFFLDPAGTFGHTQLIAGTFNLTLFIVANLWFSIVVHRTSRGAPRAFVIHLDGVQQLFRLWQLQDDAVSMLVAHIPGDPLCPCRDCTRSLVQWIPWERLLRSLVQQTSTFFYMFLMRWTALVYLGDYVWPQAWGAALGAFSLFSLLQYILPAFVYTFFPASDPLVRTRTRVYRRATYLSLSSFLSRSAAALMDPDLHFDTLPDRELFAELHKDYALSWSAVGVNPSTSFLITATLPITFLQLVIAASTGSCIPAWILSCFIWVPLFVMLALFEIPSINGQMDAITELYRGAHLSLVSLLSESARLLATPHREGVRDCLRARAALLHALSGSVEHHRIRFAGLPVTYGLAKTIAVTMLTLMVGCWSILRGFGIFVTLQTYCPTPA
ncbi:hypothetical protein DFJ74DRAFT_713921 [Hyaloraphidium curvatum]|nr:hypothetical protein DFJ74DRAFT_713921 [Hyaloraphidium curvatum]